MKRLLLSVLLFVPMLAASTHHPFVRYDRNVLERPAGSAPTYDLFLRKLDTLVTTGGADVSILHVGGSHVQGGTWSDRLRRHFLSLRYGCDGGRGLVFPFSAAGTNTPSSYRSAYSGTWEWASCLRASDVPLGLTGMALVARDTSARAVIDLLPREPHIMQHRYTFRQVDVLGEGTLEPVLLLGPKDTLRGRDGHFEIPYYTDWLQLAFAGRGTYTLRGFYLDKPGHGLSYSEAGVNGASTTSWLRCERWEKDLRRVRPDLVIFSIGINDIQGADFDVHRFKEHYRQLVKAVRRVNPRCALLFTGINDSWRRRDVNEHTETVEKAFRELAKEYKGVCWDWYEVMGGYGSMAKWLDAGLAQSDKVHFTPLGYRFLGDLLFEAIYESYLEVRK